MYKSFDFIKNSICSIDVFSVIPDKIRKFPSFQICLLFRGYSFNDDLKLWN